MRRFASFLLVLGAAIAAAGSVGLAIGFRPSDLPAALVDISVYKLVFVASAAVLAAGAVLSRAERRYRAGRDAGSGGPAELGSGDPADALRRAESARDRERGGR